MLFQVGTDTDTWKIRRVRNDASLREVRLDAYEDE